MSIEMENGNGFQPQGGNGIGGGGAGFVVSPSERALVDALMAEMDETDEEIANRCYRSAQRVADATGKVVRVDAEIVAVFCGWTLERAEAALQAWRVSHADRVVDMGNYRIIEVGK